MRLLLDSHVFLWWKAADPRLSSAMVRAIAEAEAVYVSAATAWELGLKVSLGKLRLPESVEDGIVAAGFTEIPVHFRHTRESVRLPPHHHDPFDRMLVAQALCEGLTLMTHDDRITQYEVAVLRVP
ncbi:MAG: type II toxin-antitoxin system VapC family toxin [Deltaproteobacteria bacterium]|nr:type II toxin-antitoxin system VapC family toxin [Deltaproteobacteria bacterium]